MLHIIYGVFRILYFGVLHMYGVLYIYIYIYRSIYKFRATCIYRVFHTHTEHHICKWVYIWRRDSFVTNDIHISV